MITETDMEFNISADIEIPNHGDLVDLDNEMKDNDDLEEMPVTQCLHVPQGAVSGQKVLIVTSVIICFLSLIMNFVIFMYK